VASPSDLRPDMRPDMRYAGFWLRVSPAVLDLIVLSLALGVFVSFVAIAKGTPAAFLNLRPGDPPSAVVAAFGKPALALIVLFFIVSGWLYFALLDSSPWQGTLGKKFFGLIVTDTDGRRITFGRATRRYFCGHFWLSLIHIFSRSEGLKHLKPGQVAFTVISENSTREAHRLIAAGIGLALPADKSMYGYLSEHHSFGETEEVAGEYTEELAAEMLATTLNVDCLLYTSG